MRSGSGCRCGCCTSSFRGKEAEAWAKPGAAARRSLLEPPRRLNLGAGSGPARRRAQDRGCMPEDQAGTAMVREQGLPEPQPPATLVPTGLPLPSSGAPSALCFTLPPCYRPLGGLLLLPRVPRPPAVVTQPLIPLLPSDTLFLITPSDSLIRVPLCCPL